jgi:serine/threonine-protein kinase RsbW
VAPDVRPRPGGVGIHMVKQLVDSFEYTRIDGRNQVILTKQYAKQQWP